MPIVDTNEDATSQSLRNPVHFREAWKLLFRVWRPCLTPTEFIVVQFIFDRTAAWGKEWEAIPMSHFTDGVRGKGGEVYATGMGCSRLTVSRAVKELMRIGVVFRTSIQGRMAYALNYAWQPTRMTVEETEQCITRDTSDVSPMIHLNNRKEKGSSLHEDRVPVDGLTSTTDQMNPKQRIQERALQSMERSRQRREAKKNKLTPQGLEKIWIDACLLHHGAALSMTTADASMLKRYADRLNKAGKDHRAFIEWVVEKWLVIRNMEFAWMGATSPATPSIRFLIKFSDRFEQQWEAKATFDKRAEMSQRDKAKQRLIGKGHSIDQADAVVAIQEQAAKQQRATIDQAKAADRRRKEMERALLDRFKEEAPIRKRMQTLQTRTEDATGTFEDWK